MKKNKLKAFIIFLFALIFLLPGCGAINTSTPEDTALGFSRALIEGDIDKATKYLIFSEDPDSRYYKNLNKLSDMDKENLLNFGEVIKNGKIGENWDSYAEWLVEMDINGKMVKAPVILYKIGDEWKIDNF